MLSPNFSFYKTTKTDKKSILRFYKKSGYSASFMGYDNTYWLLNNNEIVGSVILSYVEDSNTCALLHGLFISPSFRNQHLGYELVSNVLQIHTEVICFADESLTAFYNKLGLHVTNNEEIPECMQGRYSSYIKKNKNLKIFSTGKPKI